VFHSGQWLYLKYIDATPYVSSNLTGRFCFEMKNLNFLFAVNPTEHKKRVPALDAVVTPDDVRYFTSETDDISNLEASVQENPCDVQLWIKLAYKYLNQSEG